jgi:hypothetical protein
MSYLERFESRTIEHLVDMARTITVATMDICIEKGGAKPALEQCPASGYRVKLDELDMTVVLTKHLSQSAFVAVTMYPTGEAA